MRAAVTGQADAGRRGSVIRAIPEASVARLAGYLRLLSGIGGDAAADATISSGGLAAMAGVNPAKLRKDLSYLGSHGTRGVGYHVGTLVDALERALGAHETYPVALAGIGHLGSALAGYPGFSGRGFPIRVLLDSNPAKVGTRVAGLPVTDIAQAVPACRAAQVTIGVITTPEAAAQQVADVLVEAGVRSILHFAPGRLTLPDDVELRRVDLALELQMLAFHESRRGGQAAQLEAL